MAFQHGLSGLNAASKNLDVIGHNIANANTTVSRPRAPSSPTWWPPPSAAGGSNAGIGVEVAPPWRSSSRRATSRSRATRWTWPSTAAASSCCSSPMAPPPTPARATSSSTRTGDLVTNSGAQVLGYPIDPATGLRTATDPRPAEFPTAAPIPAKQTTKITAAFNLDARAKDAAGDPPPPPPSRTRPRPAPPTAPRSMCTTARAWPSR
jgi:flagellar hook protein FlgE